VQRAGALERDRPISIEFQLIQPLRALVKWSVLSSSIGSMNLVLVITE